MDISNKERAKQIILEIVRQAGGKLDNKTNLFKAFYHSHLKFAESSPGFLSEWPIVRMPNGPGIDKFDVLVGELMAEGHLRTTQVQKGNVAAFRFTLTDKPVPDMGADEVMAIRYGVMQVHGKTAAEVSKKSHRRAWQETSNGSPMNIYVDLIPDEDYERQDRVRKAVDGAFDVAIFRR